MSEHLSDDYLKLAEAPGLIHPGYPICDACDVETDPEGDQWLCPSCGTVWPGDNLEADASEAQMFDEWSGETLIGQVCPNDLAWRVSHLRDPSEREKSLSKLLKERNDV